MKSFLRTIVIFSVLIIMVTSCSTIYEATVPDNVNTIYNPASRIIHPEYMIYHRNDSGSYLISNFYTPELHANNANPEKVNMAQIAIHYRLYHISEKREMIDSATINYKILKNKIDKQVINYIPIKTKLKGKYMLLVFTTDKLRKKSVQNFIEIEKNTVNSPQNFIITLKGESLPSFSKNFTEEDIFQINHADRSISDIYVEYYSKPAPMPMPPFHIEAPAREMPKSDSLWKYSYSDSLFFSHPYKGTYCYKVDTGIPGGKTIFNFQPYFPLIKTPQAMLAPLRYITTSIEYENMATSADLKKAIDDFWLDATGNIDRAKELIRIYYNRVQYANFYFTSYTQGWKTDRGMIYTIFGPPKIIHKNDFSEKWIYGKTQKMEQVSFEFIYKEHPLSINHYVLSRSGRYTAPWREAVETWRNGRAFYVED